MVNSITGPCERYQSSRAQNWRAEDTIVYIIWYIYTDMQHNNIYVYRTECIYIIWCVYIHKHTETHARRTQESYMTNFRRLQWAIPLPISLSAWRVVQCTIIRIGGFGYTT